MGESEHIIPFIPARRLVISNTHIYAGTELRRDRQNHCASSRPISQKETKKKSNRNQPATTTSLAPLPLSSFQWLANSAPKDHSPLPTVTSTTPPRERR